jgi:hypothetical protein
MSPGIQSARERMAAAWMPFSLFAAENVYTDTFKLSRCRNNRLIIFHPKRTQQGRQKRYNRSHA